MISPKDREILREVAKLQLEAAHSEKNKEAAEVPYAEENTYETVPRLP